MKINEIRDLSTAELEEKLQDYKKELFNPKRITEVKKSIARILTVINARELEGSAN